MGRRTEQRVSRVSRMGEQEGGTGGWRGWWLRERLWLGRGVGNGGCGEIRHSGGWDWEVHFNGKESD